MKTATRPKRWEVAAAAVAALGIMLSVSACGQSDQAGASSEAADSGAIETHYQAVQPPFQPTGLSQYRANLNYAEASQVLGTDTTSFFMNAGEKDPFFWCPSHGGAVPNTAQETNPDYVEPDPNASTGSVIIGNMDPNGVYSPPSSSGTYVMCETNGGVQYLVYWEGNVMQLNAPAVWNTSLNGGQGGIQVTGSPTMPVCYVTEYKGKAATECKDPAPAPAKP